MGVCAAVTRTAWGTKEVVSVCFSPPPTRKTGVYLEQPPHPLAGPVGTKQSGFSHREEKADP